MKSILRNKLHFRYGRLFLCAPLYDQQLQCSLLCIYNIAVCSISPQHIKSTPCLWRDSRPLTVYIHPEQIPSTPLLQRTISQTDWHRQAVYMDRHLGAIQKASKKVQIVYIGMVRRPNQTTQTGIVLFQFKRTTRKKTALMPYIHILQCEKKNIL